MDRLILREMRFFAHHGVYPEETGRGQVFIVTVELEVPTMATAQSDRLEQAIDYPAVWAATRDVLEGPRRHLIETLAEHVAAGLLQRFTVVTAVTVEVAKPAPPVTFSFAGVAVRIRRERNAQG